ncbi:hypothetical protein GCM10009680_61440 [Streptomyces yatensis]|uniref:Uncharacterized protein n=1 Tax=Streptomyces yatensis TaxID=155177 RepID=A0ABN2IUL4_9ACTN
MLLSQADVFGEGFHSFHGPPRLVTWGWPAVLRAWWASGAGLEGSGHVGGTGGLHAEVAEPPSDPGRGEPTRLRRPFPGAAKILGEGPGKAELGVGGDDQPRPQVGSVRIADLRCGSAQTSHDANVSSGCGQFGGERDVFVDFAGLEAVAPGEDRKAEKAHR